MNGICCRMACEYWLQSFCLGKKDLLRSLDCTSCTRCYGQLPTAAMQTSLESDLTFDCNHWYPQYNYCKSHWSSQEKIMHNSVINLILLAGATAKFRAIPGRESTNWRSDQARQRWRISANGQRFHFDVEGFHKTRDFSDFCWKVGCHFWFWQYHGCDLIELFNDAPVLSHSWNGRMCGSLLK